jgi:NAD(P)-dependent dehydrogenase (short-subunit alcohol dehydrogenase family)
MKYKGIFLCERKVAVVIGGAGLLGKEIVHGLQEFGADVYVADKQKMKFTKGVKFISVDITDTVQVDRLIKTIVRKHKRIDVLINCAYPRTNDWSNKLEFISMESWKKNMDDHLGGYFYICQQVAKQMQRQQKGSIINFASIYGVVAPDFSIYEGTDMTMPAAYASIKAGIISLTKYIATYYGKTNVRANSISPGGVFDGQTAAFVSRYSQRTPLGRMGNPDEIVGAVIYLASDASSYVTGQNLIVDGGWSTW